MLASRGCIAAIRLFDGMRSGAVRLVLNKDSQTLYAVQDILWQTALRLEDGLIGLARLDLATASGILLLPIASRRAFYNRAFFVRVQNALALISAHWKKNARVSGGFCSRWTGFFQPTKNGWLRRISKIVWRQRPSFKAGEHQQLG